METKKKIVTLSIAIVFLFTFVLGTSYANEDIAKRFQLSPEQLKSFISTPIPNKVVEEKIVFAVNKDFADRYPSWKENADEIISLVNKVLKKNTKKQLKIARYMTYEVPDTENAESVIQDITQDQSFYYANSSDPNDTNGGLTVFYYIRDNNISAKSTGGDSFFLGKNYGFALMKETTTRTTLRPKEEHEAWSSIDSSPAEDYYRSLEKVLHEIGHGLGLAATDWYLFYLQDLSGVEPILPDYYPVEIGGTDPMGSEYVGFFRIRFSKLNAFILNHNLYHQLNSEQIQKALPQNMVVRVKDANGKPIPEAEVKIFTITKSKVPIERTASLRETVQTGKDGSVKMEIPPYFFAEIIKVSKDQKGGGAYVTLIDLQRTRLRKNKNTHYINVVLK